MSRRILALGLAGAALCGCGTPPTLDDSAAKPPEPVVEGGERRPTAAPSSTMLEERHRARALAYARDSNWADALLQWELLALLRPTVQEYREAVVETRSRIKSMAAAHMRAADLARKQDNLDRASLLYLRALNLDRDNATAAQALREIDAERNKRAYANRLPRMRM